MSVQTVPWPAWAASCKECAQRWTFPDDVKRDAFVKSHRLVKRHQVLALMATVRRPARHTPVPKPPPIRQREITLAEAIANVANVLGVAAVIA